MGAGRIFGLAAIVAASLVGSAKADENKYSEDTVVIGGKEYHVTGAPGNQVMTDSNGNKYRVVGQGIYDSSGRQTATIQGNPANNGTVIVNGKATYVVNPTSNAGNNQTQPKTKDDLQKKVDDLYMRGMEFSTQAGMAKDEKEKSKFYGLATREFEKAAGVGAENDHDALAALAACYRDLKQYGKAEQTLRKGLTKFPKSLQLRVDLAKLYSALGRSEEAVAQYRLAGFER